MNEAFNLLDVDYLVQQFLTEREQSIRTLHRVYFKNDNQLSFRVLIQELAEELRTGCITFLNKDRESSPLDELPPYLFYIANAHCKKIAIPAVKKQVEYVCSGCIFLGKPGSITFYNGVFQCDECDYELKNTTDPKRVYF